MLGECHSKRTFCTILEVVTLLIEEIKMTRKIKVAIFFIGSIN